jgi:4-aminobutyrate aminotransferase-like enzyme
MPAGRHGINLWRQLSHAQRACHHRSIEEEKLCERAQKLGDAWLKRLRKFAEGKSYIGEVRGVGLMIGIEFNDKMADQAKN